MKLLLSATCAALMAGCAVHDDVKSELKDLTKSHKSKIDPLPAPGVYEAHSYDVESLADPFSPAKISMQNRPSKGNQPDLKRAKEALEAFPLETVRMVGSVSIKGKLHVVLLVDGAMYHVREGNYVGQDYGRVMKVRESELVLKEMIQEPSGDWSERETILSIQDSTEVKKK